MDTFKMKVVDPFSVNEIVDKQNYSNFLNSEMDVTQPKDIDGVNRDIIPVDMGGLREWRFTEVAPNTTIPAHSHKNPIFRLITDGEAIVNGKSYKKGDWMVIPPDTEYEITTTIGYTADWQCAICF